MKILSRLLLVAIIGISLSNCKKDETVNGNIAGQWKMTDIHCDDGESTFDLLGTEFTETYSYHGTEYNTVTTFTENPNEFSSTGSYTFEITTVFAGTPTTQEIEVSTFQGTGEWSIDGETLTQVFGGATTLITILELTGNKMRLRQNLDVTLNGVHNTATVLSTFERI